MLPEVFPHPSNSLNSGVPVCAVATGVGKQAPGVQTASPNRNGRSQELSEVKSWSSTTDLQTSCELQISSRTEHIELHGLGFHSRASKPYMTQCNASDAVV